MPATTTGLVAACSTPVEGTSIAVRKDGTLVAWGDNGAITGNANVNSIKDAVQVACTQGGVAVVRADRTVVGWGGPGVPAALQNAATAKVVQIAASEEAYAVVREDSSILVWGGDIAGKHGILNGKTGFKAVGGGLGGLLGIKLDGSVVVAARDGTQIDNNFFDAPADLKGVVQASLAEGAAVALKADGKVVVWGSQAAGAPGDLKPVVSVGVGQHGNSLVYLAVQVDGKVRGWGRFLNPDSGNWTGGVPPLAANALNGISGAFAVDPQASVVLNCLGSCGAVSDQGCCDGDKAYRCDDGKRVVQSCDAKTCGWASAASAYQCSTTGAPAPGQPL
jgi:hypothetical protein